MSLLKKLWSLGTDDINVLRAVARVDGPVSPVGEGNKKTNSPGTYRRVGQTCPSSCEFLGSGCYAKSGRVAMSQTRDDGDRESAYRSFLVGAVAALRKNKLVRVHVSGDFGLNDRVDHEYVHLISDASAELKRLARVPHVGWGYTHFKAGNWSGLLRESGIALRESGKEGMWGAVVRSSRKLRKAGEFVCPAQLAEHMNCNNCRLCWERPDLTVVFLPEGTPSSARAVQRRLESQGR